MSFEAVNQVEHLVPTQRTRDVLARWDAINNAIRDITLMSSDAVTDLYAQKHASGKYDEDLLLEQEVNDNDTVTSVKHTVLEFIAANLLGTYAQYTIDGYNAREFIDCELCCTIHTRRQGCP
jgi:hypothetical protein